jgi:hypothetical protein
VSHDYLLFRAPGPGPMASWAPEPPAVLGSADEMIGRLDDGFPGIAWSQFGSTWFGRWEQGERSAEFQLTPDADGTVRSLTMRRVDRTEVERVCEGFGLVAVDPAMELYLPELGSWTQER